MKNIIKFLHIIFILQAFTFRVTAQNNIIPLHFNEFSNEMQAVYHMVQSDNGVFWFISEEGFFSYDGLNTVQYKTKDYDFKNHLGHIVKDNKGNIWIGTLGKGIFKFNPRYKTFTNYVFNEKNSSIRNNQIYSLHQDNNGRLWIGTKSGIDIFDTDKNKFIPIELPTENKEMTPHLVGCFTEDDSNIWAGTSKHGIFKIDKSTLKVQQLFTDDKQKSSFSNHQILSLCFDAKQNLWIGTNQGLKRYNGNLHQIQNISLSDTEKYNNLSINSLVFSDDRFLWFGTNNNGIFLFNTENKAISHAYNKNGKRRFPKQVFSLLKTNSGNIWAGTSSGVYVYQKEKHKFDSNLLKNAIPQQLSDTTVWSFEQDKENNVWIGTENGLIKYNLETKKSKTYKKSRYKNSLSNNIVKALHIGSDETVWIGTQGGGLCNLNPKNNKIKRYTHQANNPFSISNNIIWSIDEDKDGNIWIGTDHGLNKYDRDKKEFERFLYNPDNPESLSYPEAYAVLCSSDGSVWVGTDNGLSVLEIRQKKFSNFYNIPNKSSSIAGNSILSIFEDKNNDIWVGTQNGLNKYNRQNTDFERYTKKNGLICNIIIGIHDDLQGNLWLTSNRGFSKFNIKEKSFENYSKKDGLPSNLFNPGAILMLDNGEMLLGSTEGITHFKPEIIKKSQHNSIPVLTNLLIDNKRISQNTSLNNRLITPKHIHDLDTIQLFRPEEKSVSIGFSNPEINDLTNFRIAYLLEGFHEKWTKTENGGRTINLLNLPYGEYTLRTKITNPDGLWSSNERLLKIIVKPAFWETWWAKTFAFFLLCFIAFLLNKFILKKNNKTTQKIDNLKQNLNTPDLQANNTTEPKLVSLDILNEISKDITSNLSTDGIIETIYKKIIRVLEMDTFCIGIFNPRLNRLDFPGSYIEGNKVPFFSHELNDRSKLSVWCYTNSQEVIINDYQNEYKNYIAELNKKKNSKHPESIIMIPLTFKEKKVGILSLQSYTKKAFTDFDISLLRNISVFVAIALENALVYEDALTKNTQIESQKYELEIKNNELLSLSKELQDNKDVLQEQQKLFGENINSVKDLQKDIFPSQIYIDKFFSSFRIEMPIDKISGDFYWFEYLPGNSTHNDYVFVAVGSCSGADIQKGFLSIMTSRLLSEIIGSKKILSPNQILKQLNHDFNHIFNPQITGFDENVKLSLCRLEPAGNNTAKIKFAGADSPLIYYCSDKNDIGYLTGSEKTIGNLTEKPHDLNFEEQDIKLSSESVLYLTSKGISSILGNTGSNNYIKSLSSLLERLKHTNLEYQENYLNNEFAKLLNNKKQKEDITLWGIMI